MDVPPQQEYAFPAQQPFGVPPGGPVYSQPPPPMAPSSGYMYPPPQGQFPMPGYAPQGAPPGEAPPMAAIDGVSDHPDHYIPDTVKSFIPFFHRQVLEKNVPVILKIYEDDFGKLSDRFFTEGPWPNADLVSPLVSGDETFLTLYKEMQFRHIYAKHKPTLEHRFDSYNNYIELFNLILGSSEPVDLELPNQWLWDIIDEFIYQFQSFVMFRGKLKSRTSEEIQMLKENSSIWNIHSVLNVLYSLVDKSNINKQLEAYYDGEDPSSVAGEFGNHSLYKNLGYFSLIGLLRLHCQLGDYYQALQAVSNVQLSKKVLATTRVPASQISLYYYVGFCYLMMRRYKDTLRTFSNIIVFIQRAKNHFQPKSYQQQQVIKQNEQMLSIIAMVVTLNPQHVDEVVNSQLRERYQDKTAQLQKGELKTFEEMFFFACPKFMSPIPPDYDSLPENYNKRPTEHQCEVFMAEIDQQLMLPKLRSYLKFYTTMPISKLSAFMEVDEATLQEHLLRFKHKTRCLVSTTKGTKHLTGELQSVSDLDFYIDGEMLHIADTKMARRYGDFFIRQIHKLEEVLATTRVPASQISLYYYVGFCYLMMRRYKDTLRTFSNIIVFIQRAKNHFQPKSYQQQQVIKQNEQMLSIIAMVVTLNPQHVDEVVNSQLRERYQDKTAQLQKGELKTFEEMFFFACPKFMSPIPPDYDSLPENYNKRPTEHQCEVFMAEIDQQLMLPKLRSYLKFYTTMPISKLSAFMEVDEATLQEHLLRFKHKTRCLVSTTKGTKHLTGELQSVSDLDFYIDGEMLHIADTKMARRYGDFFIRQIHKLEELCAK